MKAFEIGEQWFVYDTEDGERTGDPVTKSFDTEKAANDWVVDQKPVVITPSVMSRMIADGITSGFEKMLENRQLAGDEPLGGFTTKGSLRVQTHTYNFGDFVRAVGLNDLGTIRDIYADSKMKATDLEGNMRNFEGDQGIKLLRDQVGTAGGFTVPTIFIPNLIAPDAEREIVYPRADVQQVEGPVQLPGLCTTGSTPGVSNYFGGVWFRWTESGTQKPETEPAFTQIELNPHELAGYTEIQNRLLRRSKINMDTLLTGLFRKSIMYVRDEAFLDATGAGQPSGCIYDPGTLVLNRTTAHRIVYADACNMWQGMMNSARAGAVWVINQFCLTEIMKWTDPEGHYIWQPNAREQMPQNIFGRPIIWTEKTPTLGSQGDILLADFEWYYVADEMGVQIGVSKELKIRENQTVYVCFLSIDGQEKLVAPIFAKDGVNQVSPFVVLGEGVETT